MVQCVGIIFQISNYINYDIQTVNFELCEGKVKTKKKYANINPVSSYRQRANIPYQKKIYMKRIVLNDFYIDLTVENVLMNIYCSTL